MWEGIYLRKKSLRNRPELVKGEPGYPHFAPATAGLKRMVDDGKNEFLAASSQPRI
jgi:hypothetical protein